ncbi:ABC transporter substrate-binding protein [Ketogulonicigenium vulgare]|uniref:Spermidine/putrescine ABC transporter n=1 Tax=Ketogulonicigenium vulgare (strain WSH-001) TaxID=759362 RepID=F9Y536_KETVW|nr:ABC transporter substrate-binding protein [Ketogulonicigenium vulgare]ADO42470.1 extracellular solute-binding protein family 1 [Ketogulonicigenium vulgare Y25]AEM40668.1 Spermidine/putrescine ABC transporter [Ketogulonicigenium vulgare WSH-001]ALJ80841.1 spermidine/putrescine ABC transporter [Ketogulonicigenium vulgare]ANW33619.1 spermidine/putrescine ABC transporter [Ketogulonicigenium vulgare]AOZ54382.1 extracellular solute-binding protein family 1 [Ketogulonicigenium vulgare]
MNRFAKLLLTTAFVAQTGFAAAQTLVVSEWGYTPDQTDELVNAPFEAEHGVEIIVETGNNPDRLNKMAVRGGVDVILLTDAFSQQGIDRDVFGTIDAAELSNLSQLTEAAQRPQGDFGPAYAVGRYGIIYDSAKVEPITSWSDLWREDLAGQIAMPGFNTSSGPMTVLVAASRVGVDAYADPDAAFASLAELSPNIVKTYNTGSELVNLFSTGEITVGALQDFAVPAILAAVPTARWAPLDEGNFAIYNTLNIAADTPNRDLAIKYIDFRISAAVQQAMALAVGDGPTNTTVALPEGEYPFASTPDQINSLISVDYSQLLAVRDDWATRWNDVFGQ